ncbi:RNA polymerase Rpb4-domain-containing protein [Pisolithus croceorrhizus]|nr:RNA polymerase Rpb4-domain-containing protein [Pisolithus croceorrhizus]
MAWRYEKRLLAEQRISKSYSQVVNSRAALLSNFEVLTLLRELDSKHVARTKAAVRTKKEEDAAGKPTQDSHIEEVSENLRTVELEAIQYLSAEYQPMRQQCEAGVTQLVKDLAPFGLTKAEKLQIVNLAPTEAVELYVIVEELEDRLGDQMDQVLSVVSRSLQSNQGHSMNCPPSTYDTVPEPTAAYAEVYEEEERWEHDANDLDFDDFGEGVGVEGDLDMEDVGE